MRRALWLALIGCTSASTAVTGDGGAPGTDGGPERSPDAALTRDTSGARLDSLGQPGPDVAPEPAPAGCPGPEAYQGNPAWKDTLAIAAPAPRLCARWVESDGTLDVNSTANSLKDSLARKVRASVAPGSYKLPDQPGKSPLALPVCLQLRDRVQATGPGTVNRRMFNSTHVWDLELPAGAGLVRGALLWDGPLPVVATRVDNLTYCSSPPCEVLEWSYLAECTGDLPSVETVALEGGTVELTVDFVKSSGISAGTEAASFTRASGTFRGTAFDQRDYFKLIYSPEHHHFTRHYAVLFDNPIDGACGLELVNLPGPPSMRRAVHAYTVDCQLNRQAEVKVTGVMAGK